MKAPKWLRKDTIIAVHQKTLLEQGGAPAFVMKVCWSRPSPAQSTSSSTRSNRNLFDLAAAYGFGIASNHPFIDGNKRVAFYASVGFLRINGVYLKAGEADAAVTFVALAAGELSEEELASWFRNNSEG